MAGPPRGGPQTAIGGRCAHVRGHGRQTAHVLLKAGATQVNVLCLAVGVLPEEWNEP